MAEFAVRFKDFSGGDWGEADPARAKDNQFSGRNVSVYSDGLLGVRPGLKLLNLTGKVVGLPATYSGLIRGFDVMGNKLILATATQTFDIYWDLSLAPGGTLPANNPIPLPGGISATANAQFLRGADTAMKEFLLVDGKLYYRTGDPTGAWTLTGPAGKNLSMVTRWNLYLVAVDRDQPWIIWFSNVDASGPNFLTWPANNFLYVGTTETITALLSIFNMLYAGRQSGWWGISGVLGVQASVRELAIGNGPVDQRFASVTTDNRICYWPMQKAPAFWNGERVQLVPEQRMDPRGTYLDTTPVQVTTAPPDPSIPAYPQVRLYNGRFDTMPTPTVLRRVGTAWTASGARAAGTATVAQFINSALDNTTLPLPPGWSTLSFDQRRLSSGVVWSALGDGITPASTIACRLSAELASTSAFPTGCVLAVFVNDVERVRQTVTIPTKTLYFGFEATINAGDKVSVKFFNSTAGDLANLVRHLLPQQVHQPELYVDQLPAYSAGERWVCPTTDNYDLHAEMRVGGSTYSLSIAVNGVPVASSTLPVNFSSSVPEGSPVVLDANNIRLTAGDTVALAGYGDKYTQVGYIMQGGTTELDGTPLLRINSRTTVTQVGVLGVSGDSVVVTPTERRLMLMGDDGATTKVWTYGAGTWTHHYVPVLLAGMAPSDVRGAYQLPEHVVFATKRTYTNEALKVWTLNHDLDRPGFVSDQWASPYDQSMPGGDVLVKGEVSFPRWFDGQGRQSRARSVVVQFRKWDQGIAGGMNQITARVDACGPYEGGVQAGEEVAWSEPMSASSPNGTDDSWRFNVGEQGFANGFQVVFTGLYGVAIREVVVTVDMRTERV